MENVNSNNADHPPRQSTLREYFESFVVTIVLALFGTTFVVQAFKIPTPSMEDNLLVGDHLLVNKFVYGHPGGWLKPLLPFQRVRHGDVIVFRYPEDPSKHYVKRAIGLPGDRIRMQNQRLYRNGKLVAEPYVFHKRPGRNDVEIRDTFPLSEDQINRFADYNQARDIHLAYRYFKEFTDGRDVVVPPGRYFAMGDNRDNSADSRYWGFVPRKNIVGRAFIIYWSFETGPRQHLQDSLSDRTGRFADVLLNFFRKTRWNRTFKLVG